MTNLEIRKELPPLPDRMKKLPLDHRGYPVPWFVAWLDEHGRELPSGEGKPDFRVLGTTRIYDAVTGPRCWICGDRLAHPQENTLEGERAFVIGPMCMVNRINSEPPSHIDCADFAARACPFLARPHMVRRESGLPPGVRPGASPGVPIARNPKVAVVWITNEPFSIKGDGKGGVLFNLPNPTEVRFYAEGEVATREQVRESVMSGMPLLLDCCRSVAEEMEVRALVVESKRWWPDLSQVAGSGQRASG